MKTTLLTLGSLIIASALQLTPAKQVPEIRDVTKFEHKQKLTQLASVELATYKKVPISTQDIAYSIALEKGWGGAEWNALKHLWGNESSWNTDAINPSSGACGIPQAWPCSKIGANWRDPRTQLEWGASYIQRTYGTPSNALAKWYSRCGSDKGCWY